MRVYKNQHWHIIFLFVLLIGIKKTIDINPLILEGSLLGINTKSWLILSIIIPIAHQIYVLICWRLELYHKQLSKNFGENSFLYYKRLFTFLIILRPISVTILSISNSNTFYLDSTYYCIIIISLLIPGLYAQYSVAKFFGFDRAFGIDHFEPEKYKNLPFVNKGIFKYTSNGMYLFAFFLIWLPGVIFESQAALLLALFQHLYIWIHYYCTELPDIKYIYEK